ncbi:MAG TPA: peptidase M61 [Sphingorhabdus lacus]|jgi:predicted metalloprotease with PDZ domain|nr:peptidase M61 [Sphingorhabdus lacus]
MNSRTLTRALAALALSSSLASAAYAQKSAPQPVPIVDRVPEPEDRPLPAPMVLEVDATDVARAIFRVKQTIPVEAGKPLTLLYPQWLPGKHGPRGALAEMTGLKVRAGGKLLEWTRDPVEVYAFHVDTPAGTKSVDVEFQFTSPVRESEGRIVVTPAMMNVQWEQVSLYPAGHFTRAIEVKPSITLPSGWTGVAALDGGKITGDRIDYATTSYETLVDSPMFAGPHYRKWDLGNKVTLNVWADEAKYLDAKPEHIAAHKALVDEALVLFGSKHFDRYEFLLALTDELGGIGLEHHRSSENSRDTDYFTKWADNGSERGLLPHELTHSWNGKFRRPSEMWTPNYSTPMRDNLLWVYEGQTSYWDLVLAARSGLQTKEMVLAEWARYAGFYAEQPGRDWRSVEDTTHDPIFGARKPKPFSSHARGEDYYNEGSLIWLAADMTIRELSKGSKSLDDFAKAFFGVRDADWGVLTYDFDEVVRTLNAVQPYDWATFLDAKLRKPGQPAPLTGFEKGGYKLVWKEEPNIFDRDRMKDGGSTDLTHSLGLTVDKEGKVTSVMWNGPAFKADIVNGAKILAVGGMGFTKDRLTEAVTAAKDGKTPIRLIVERNKRFEQIDIAYSGGLRYPHLESAGKGETAIDRLLAPRRPNK